MNAVFAITLFIAPFVVGAVVFGVVLAASARWFISNPEKWLFFAIIVFSVPAFIPGGDGADGSLFKQLTWGGLFLFAAVHVFGLFHGRFSWPHDVLPPVSLLLLVGFILLSTLWSPSLTVSAKRATQIIGVLIIAMAIARSTNTGEPLHHLLLVPVGFFVVIGFLFAVIAPATAFDSDHSLRALSSHKNTWGQFSLLASLTVFFNLIGVKRKRALVGLVLGLAVLSLLLSKSTTSILAFALVSGVTALFFVLYRGGLPGKLFAATLLLLGVLAAHVYVVVTGESPIDYIIERAFLITGKTTTLTGRTYLWQLIGAEIAKHPWLGIGYGGFWNGMNGPSVTVISRLDWGPPSQAHSGYLDVVNEVGFIGAALLVFVMVGHLWRISRLWRILSTGEAAFHGSLLAAALIINYAESSLLRTTHLWWVVLCISMVVVHSKVRHVSKHIVAKVGKVPIYPTTRVVPL